MSVRAPHITCSPVRRPVMMSGRDRDAGASVRVDSIDQLLRGASICESSASGGRAADLRAATTFAGSLSTTADSCIALIILVVKEWRQLGPAAEQAALAGAIRAPKVRLRHLGQDLFHTVGTTLRHRDSWISDFRSAKYPPSFFFRPPARPRPPRNF